MDEKLLNWEDGTNGAFNRCSTPRICAAPQTWGRHSIEAPGWGRAQAPAMNRALVDPGHADRQRFMRMSNTDKLGVAIRQLALRLPAEARHHAMALVDPANLAIMAGALAIWVGAQATPIGWVADIAMFGMGVVAIGAEAVDVARELRDFAMGVLGAEDESELRAAVDHLAKAIAIVGVDVVVALLLKKAIVKVREPKMAVPEGGDSKLLFGKYDPRTVQKRLPPEKVELTPKPKPKLTYPVETKPNEAFFWSGKTNGVGGEAAARQIAIEKQGTTLEALMEKRGVKMPDWDPNNPEVVKAWKTVSADYASGASGTVRAVIGQNLRPGNVWETAELPALMKNPNVDKIITIDPLTKAEKAIFIRN